MDVSYIQTRHTCQHYVGGDKFRNMNSVSRHVKVGASAHHAHALVRHLLHIRQTKKNSCDKNVHQSERDRGREEESRKVEIERKAARYY